MFSGAAASMAAFLCPQDLPFVLIIRGALKLKPRFAQTFRQLVKSLGQGLLEVTQRIGVRRVLATPKASKVL